MSPFLTVSALYRNIMHRFAVREKYPVDRGKERTGAPSEEFFHDILQKAKHDESLKKVLNPQLGTREKMFLEYTRQSILTLCDFISI